MFFVDLQFSKGTFNIGDLSNMQNALVMCFSLLYDFLADELYMAECCGISSHKLGSKILRGLFMQASHNIYLFILTSSQMDIAVIFSYCERKKSFNVSHWGMYGLN